MRKMKSKLTKFISDGFKNSLWLKFFYLYTLPIIAMIFIWVIYFSISTEKKNFETLLQYRETLNEQTISVIDSDASTIHRQSYTLYSDTESMLTIFSGPSSYGYHAACEKFRHLMSNFMLISKNFDGILLLDLDGNNLFFHDRYDSYISTRNFSNDNWYQQIIESSGKATDIILPTLQINNSDTLVVATGKYVFEPETYKKIGVMLYFCYIDNFAQIIEDSIMTEGEHLHFSDKMGNCIYHYGVDFSNSEYLEPSNYSDHYELIDINGTSMIRIITTSDKYHWFLCSYTPYSRASVISLLWENTTVLFFLLVILITLIVSFIHYKQLLRRIKTLTSERYELKLAKTQSELEALQSQINPHFLFNTLNSIKSVAYTGNSEKTAQMTQSLSDLMHYSLGHGKYIVSFAEEIATVKKYLYLQNIRFGNRYSIRYDIEDEVMSLEIPRLVIQPLVENSIKHGLEHITQNGLLIITAKLIDNHVYIYVANNGSRIPAEKLCTLNKKFSDFTSSTSFSHENIGLMNVCYRLQLHYPNNFGMKMSSTEKFTTTKLVIPAKQYVAKSTNECEEIS